MKNPKKRNPRPLLTFYRYKFKDLNKWIDKVKNSSITLIRKNKNLSYYNVSCSFDIESSSYYENDIIKPENKRGCMYAWVFNLNGCSILGRTWKQFQEILSSLSDLFNLSTSQRIIVYVHNLAFDFQFFRKWVEWESVFSIDNREPLKAVSLLGFEFRCSYKLSGYSLAKIGENLNIYKDVYKKVGDLDYSLKRHYKTPLTETEEGYIYSDSEVVIAYIEEEIIKANGLITNIPLTKTGKIRNYCRRKCFYEKKSHKKAGIKYLEYRGLMNRLTITSELEYIHLKQTFTGGFTHANHNHVNKTLKDVYSFDFTSSYPAVMIAERFPMSKGKLINLKSKEEFEKCLKLYCCIFKATFYYIVDTFNFDHYISLSKCIEQEEPTTDNGRIITAKKITIYLTNLDFEIISKTYSWEKLEISNMRIYKRGYLPKDFILSILELYQKKTTLKGVEDKIIEYQESKEELNGCYGMSVTDICRNEITYNNNEWGEEPAESEKQLEKYNKDKRRFLFYAWGIFVTCYAKFNLCSGILHLKNDYIYSDTDSLKFFNLEKHKIYFDTYNKIITDKINKCLDHYGINKDMANPKTIKGENKPIGVWDFDGHYKYFKTLGAKRYAFVKEDNSLSLVVSGINKKCAIPYLKEKYKTNENILNAFKDGLYIPKGYTGKQTHTYIDDSFTSSLIDYKGVKANIFELSAIHLEESDYELSLTTDYIKYLLGCIIKENTL